MKKLFLLTLASVLISFASFATLYPITGSIGSCVGAYGYVTDTSLGGTWTSSNTSVATIGSTSGNVFGVAAGTTIITYTAGGSYVTELYTVTAAPAGITGTLSECVGATTTVADATLGGTWSSSASWVASIGSTSGVITGVSAGFAYIYYTVGPGCFATQYDTVVGPPLPDSIYGPTSVCVGSTITMSDLTSGGTWSASGGATVSPAGVVTGVTAGTAIISYGVSGICGTGYRARVITVNSSTAPGTIYGATSVMATTTTSLYDLGGLSGGTWTSSNTAIATVDASTGVVTGVATGACTITYSVTGCSGLAYTTAPMTVTAANIISGNVNFTGASYVGQVKVWLITFNPATLMLEAKDSVTVYSSGSTASYQFLGEPTDSFRIKAAINDTFLGGGTGYIPTYHSSDFYWYTATVLAHTTGTVDAGQDITMMSGIIVPGPGFISGDVSLGANKGTSGSIPAVGVRMYCVNAATGAMVQQALTDASGSYTFSNLATGLSYYVHPEVLAYLTTDYPAIALTTGSPSVSTASFIQHTKSFTITPVGTSSINNMNGKVASVVAYPNPTSGKLTIQWQEPTAEKAAVIISDITGRDIFKSTIDMNQGSGVNQVDLSGLTNGLYMISVKSAAINYISKIQVQK